MYESMPKKHISDSLQRWNMTTVKYVKKIHYSSKIYDTFLIQVTLLYCDSCDTNNYTYLVKCGMTVMSTCLGFGKSNNCKNCRLKQKKTPKIQKFAK